MSIDFQHAVRALSRARLYAAASIGALGLGIGTIATVVTIAYGSLVRPLPFPQADRLIRWGQTPIGGSGGINSTAVANFLDLRDRVRLFEGLAAEQLRGAAVHTPDGAERAVVAAVSGGYFDVLGVRPQLGRTLTDADDRAGAPRVAVITDRLWHRAFGGSADVLGREIRLDTISYAVIGIVPAALGLPGDPQAWTPFQWDAESRAVRRSRQIEPIARLRPGVSIEAASDELRARFADLAEMHPVENGNSTIAVMASRDWILGSSSPGRGLLPLIAAAAGVLLLIAYLNVATLSIGRSESRRGEQALREALGATGWRQFAARSVEASLIAAPAAVAGNLAAFWAVPLVIARFGTAIPRAATIEPGLATVVVAVCASALGAVIIAVSGGRLRGGWAGAATLNGRTATAASPRRWRLVALQIGLAAGLIYGAVLLGATLATLARTDLGVPLDGTLTFAVGLPAERYGEPARVRRYFDDLESRLRQLPGVSAAGATSRTPFAGGTNGDVSAADDSTRQEPLAEWRTVTPEFFAAIGLPVVAGRDFRTVPAAAGRSAIISEALGRTLFPSGTPIGRRIHLGSDPAPYEVVGVVGDLRDFGPTRPARPAVYLRHGSEPGFASSTFMTVILRTTSRPTALVPDVRRLVRELDADVAVERVATLDELATRSLGTSRTAATTIVVSLAAVALALGTIGVYGVVADGVAQRTREIGVRLALGDTPGGIVRRFVGDGLRLAAIGAALGALVAWFVDGLVRSVVVEAAAPRAITTVVAVLVILGVATLVAGIIPAQRAGRLSPVEALR